MLMCNCSFKPAWYALHVCTVQLVQWQLAHSLQIHELHTHLIQALHSLADVTSAWDTPTSLEEHNQLHARRAVAAHELAY